MSLGFYCRIHTKKSLKIIKNIGVLLSVEFFCLWSSTVSNPQATAPRTTERNGWIAFRQLNVICPTIKIKSNALQCNKTVQNNLKPGGRTQARLPWILGLYPAVKRPCQ
jgi:hypothetical protein